VVRSELASDFFREDAALSNDTVAGLDDVETPFKHFKGIWGYRQIFDSFLIRNLTLLTGLI